MFTKKLEDQFSADLLNTVKGILDEAKKCPKDCECEKCEKEEDEEDEDEMKEGFASAAQRKAVWATYADGGKGHPDNKKKKMKKEEVELEEGKMKELVTKHMDAGHDYATALKKAKKELGEAVGDFTVKTISPADAWKKHTERKKAKINVPVDPKTGKTLYQKMTSEEVEELDEISSKTLGSYGKKAKKEAEARNDPMHRAAGRLMASKKTNPARGGYKLTKVAATFGEEAELDEALDSMSDARIKYHATKNFPHGKYSSKEINAEHKRRMKSVPNYHTVKASLGEEAEQIDELSKDTLKSYMDKKKVPSGTVVANTNDKNSMRKYTNRVVGGVRAAKRLMAKEEAEQIDELSKATMGRYINKAVERMSTQGVTAGLKIAADEKSKKNFDNIKKREKGIAKAVSKLTKEDQDFIDSLNNEMWEEIALAEGRGRPPKEGTPAWHARQKQANDDMVALGMQLRKAKSMNKKVRFMDGKEHEVSAHHADKFEDHMAARKTSQEKAAFQKQAHKSHAEFVKAVSAPVPKASKDTGEIVKYRH